MPNVIEQLGYEYADQFYKKAIFELNGDIYMYTGHLDRNSIACSKAELVDGKWKWVNARLTPNDFPNMGTFAWPRPGYRQFQHKNGQGNLVYYFSSQRSAMRGLKPDFIELTPVPVLEIIPGLSNPRDYTDSAAIAKTIFHPQFTPFLEGMRMLRSGEAPSFAISPDVAVALSVSRGQGVEFDVMFRERVIGEVMDGDVVRVPHRFFKKSSSNELFNGRIIR